jgi:putative membrane protein
VTGPPVETQPERTALAWQRTGLGVLAVAGLLGHAAVRRGSPGLLGLAGAAALLGLGVLGGLAPARYRRLRRDLRAGGTVAAAGPVAAATAAAVLTGGAAAVAVLTLR